MKMMFFFYLELVKAHRFFHFAPALTPLPHLPSVNGGEGKYCGTDEDASLCVWVMLFQNKAFCHKKEIYTSRSDAAKRHNLAERAYNRVHINRHVKNVNDRPTFSFSDSHLTHTITTALLVS